MKKEDWNKYCNEYSKTTLKHVGLFFNKSTEKDLIAFISTKDNKQGYLKQLILDDMKK